MAGTGMFFGVTNFGIKRSAKQAIGFYIFYFIVTLILSAIAGLIFGIGLATTNPNMPFTSAFNKGVGIGTIIAVLVVIALGVLLLNAKKAFRDAISAVVALLAVVLALFGGALLGLIPIAYLTTRKANTK